MYLNKQTIRVIKTEMIILQITSDIFCYLFSSIVDPIKSTLHSNQQLYVTYRCINKWDTIVIRPLTSLVSFYSSFVCIGRPLFVLHHRSGLIFSERQINSSYIWSRKDENKSLFLSSSFRSSSGLCLYCLEICEYQGRFFPSL